MQKGNGFIKFMLVLCAVLIAAGTYFIVKSVDHLRYEMEKLRIALQCGSAVILPDIQLQSGRDMTTMRI